MCCEEIYKRIGELILARRNQEEQKLYKLQDSLNRDDLLYEGEKRELQIKEKQIENKINQPEKQLNHLLLIKNRNALSLPDLSNRYWNN